MADHESPSFEDLEPEGDEVETPGNVGNGQPGEDEDLDEFLIEARDEDEVDPYDAFEDLEDEPFSRTPRRKPTQNTLPSLAARTALKWAGQAIAPPVLRGNGRGPVTLKRARASVGRLGEDSLDEPESDPFGSEARVKGMRACSAALLEDYELMEALATLAAAAQGKAEAEGLIAAMVPLSIGLTPSVYRALWPALPGLVRGAVGVTRLLHGRPATRRLIAMMPTILRHTAAQLARYIQRDQPATRRLVARVLAKQTEVALQRAARPALLRSRRSDHNL